MSPQLLPASERVATPWKNGGGVTREISVCPTGAGMDDFDWRISMAEVREPGVFSVFPGVERCLTVIEGRLILTFGDQDAICLDASAEPHEFSGDRPCHGLPVEGPVLDLNVMWRRGHFDVETERLSDTVWRPEGDVAFLIALEPLTLHENFPAEPVTLAALDGLFWRPRPLEAPWSGHVEGRAIAISVTAR